MTVDGTIDNWSMTADVGKLDEDGTYNWFGGVTTTSEDQEDALVPGKIFEAGAFGEVYTSVSIHENSDPDAEVSVGVYAVTENDSTQP